MEDTQETKLNPDDVWKDFNCPKYITCVDHKTNKLPKEIYKITKQSLVDTKTILQKLDELISNPITNTSVPRICRLLFELLHEIGDDGFKINDLPLIIKILEFLAHNIKSVKEYELHLDRMLKLCALPPLMEKASDKFTTFDIMKQFFTTLGNVLSLMQTKEQALKVHKVLHSLLSCKKKLNITALDPEYYHKAMEKSMLPISVVKLLEASDPDVYENALELVFLLASISHVCCHRMIEVGVLNTIFARMDRPYATQMRCTRPPDMLVAGAEYPKQTTFLIMNTLWVLLKSILPPNSVPTIVKEMSMPKHCSLWGLRYAFERQICYSQHQSDSRKHRNEIAVIILAILHIFPSWNYVSSGIAEDIIKCLIAVESGHMRVFSEKVKFSRTNEELYFQKTLLLIVTNLAKIDACIYLMWNTKLMKTILHLVNPNIKNGKITWSAPQFWNLWACAMNVLSVLVPKLPDEFIKYDGTIRLLMILEWSLTEGYDTNIVISLIKTVCTIILRSTAILLNDFREHGMTLTLIRLVNHVLNLKKITFPEQRILTLTLMSIERLIKKQTFFQEIYGDQSITFTLELLFRCLYKKSEEVQIDQRLLLAIGSYIWECIVMCQKNLKNFVEYGGVYIVLDIIEIAPYPVRCLFLGILTDICDNMFCGPYLCTWRGINKKTGLMSLLATIWREEEIIIKVKRSTDGSVKDPDMPEIGSKQWSQTYDEKLYGNISPAMVDMIGSVRSKIYCIQEIIGRDSERFEMAQSRYKILYFDLPVEDRVTISFMSLYFRLKLGEVWVEIDKYFEQIGITPLGMDGQMLYLMTQRYFTWGVLIQERQKGITNMSKGDEDIEEKDEYTRIRNSKLAMALDAFDELDYIYRTSNRAYMIKKKDEQSRQVDSALNYPHNSDDAHCHRTYQDNVMFTAIYDQKLIMGTSLMLDPRVSQIKVLPVSPCNSYVSGDTCIFEISSSEVSLSSNCLLRLERYDGDCPTYKLMK